MTLPFSCAAFALAFDWLRVTLTLLVIGCRGTFDPGRDPGAGRGGATHHDAGGGRGTLGPAQ